MSLPLIRFAAGLAYREAGAGRPMLLLHAFPLSSAMWEPQFVSLGQVARILAPDLPGFGGSPLANPPWTLDSLADQLVQFLDDVHVQEPVVVVGLSMGGYLAMAMARRHAQRLAGLVLADTKAEPDDTDARTNRDRLIRVAQEHGVSAIVEAMLPKMTAPITQRTRPGVLDQLREMASGQSVAGVTAALAALRDRPDARPGLAEITLPTRVIVGASDLITPPDVAHRMAEAIPKCTLIDILGAGHMSNLERPDEFNAAVRSFLAVLQSTP